MPKDFINLGREVDSSACCVPAPEPKTKTVYPCLYITGDKYIDFGEEGTAEINYRKVESSERDREGKVEYSVEVEVKGLKITSSEEALEEAEDDAEIKKGFGESLGEAIDRAKSKRSNSNEY